MKKKLQFVIGCTFLLCMSTLQPAFAGDKRKFSNESGSQFCCCSGGSTDCGAVDCSSTICDGGGNSWF